MKVKTKQLKFWAKVEFSRTSTHTLGHGGADGNLQKPLKTLDKLGGKWYFYTGFSCQILDQGVSCSRGKNRQKLVGKKWVALLPQFAINLKRRSGAIRDLIQEIFENQNHKCMLNIKTIAV